MTRYLISFPSSAMDLSEDEFVAAGADAHAVLQDARDAGVYLVSGGINESVPPVRVHQDGRVTRDTYPQTKVLDGGFMILEVESREEALNWAQKVATACRCAQEVREFMDDPEA